MTNNVATATFHDTWAGELAAYLVPQKTTRRGQRVTAYRWMTERGTCCDGLSHGSTNPDRMIAHAERHARFSNVRRQ